METGQFLSYNDQTLNSKNKISCVGDGNLFYFSEYGKLQILHIPKKFLLKMNTLQFFSMNAIRWRGIK